MKGARHQKRVSEPHLISVDGQDLIWEERHPLYREWTKELEGVSVSVWRRPGKTRELILDLNFAVFGVDRVPNLDRWNEILSRAIRSAMEAGWDPDSRGASRRHIPA